MHDITEGGIFGALWEIGEASGTGITADLRKIPIKQETVEICEVLLQLLEGQQKETGVLL